MKFIYNLFILLYGIGISIASKFNPKAKLWIDGRKNWKKKLKQNVSASDKIIWVHCSSLGEFEQGRPVIEKVKSEFPNHKIAVSFFSPSGYEVQKNYTGADYIFYLPLDTPKNMKTLVRILNPQILILVKYEYWYNLLRRLQKRKIPVIVISGVIKEKNLFFRPFAGWFRNIIRKITHFFVQNHDSENLLESINIQQVTVSGDTRFDRVRKILNSDNDLEFVKKFKGNSKLIVAGSTWPDDEEILTNFINSNLPNDWKIVFAPHNIDPKKINFIKEKLNLPFSIYSEMDLDELENSKVLIVDTVGILTNIYSYANISYVGGGFTKTGVHNTLEPAVFGVPVIFGNNYKSYFEAVELVESEAAIKFKDQFDFNEKMLELIKNESNRNKRGKIAFDLVQQKPNSTQIILDYLNNLIQK